MEPGGSISFADYLDWVMEMAGLDDLQKIANSYRDAADISQEIGQAGFERSYYLDLDLARLAPQLQADIEVPPWYRHAPLRTLLWLGVLGTSCGLHADVTPNCNVQVVGRKSFALFAPNQTPLLYRSRRSTHCGFDPNHPDYTSYPLAHRARGMQCTLEPGEALYIPVGWYHQVTVVSPWAVNVNFFWPRPFLQGLITVRFGGFFYAGCGRAGASGGSMLFHLPVSLAIRIRLKDRAHRELTEYGCEKPLHRNKLPCKGTI